MIYFCNQQLFICLHKWNLIISVYYSNKGIAKRTLYGQIFVPIEIGERRNTNRMIYFILFLLILLGLYVNKI